MVTTEIFTAVDTPQSITTSDIPEQELRWCSVTLNEVLQQGSRLEASVFDIEGKHAKEVIKRCKWPTITISGKNGMSDSFYPPRFKRILVDESQYPLILPSQIQEINPEPKGYLSPLCNTDFNILKARCGQILMTRSGTIGNCSLVSNTLNGKTLSDDIIRISCRNEENTGYLYAFLCTKIGNALIRTNEYGAVISHIEPEHLESIQIPNPPHALKKRIHDLIIQSYALRDESNVLLDEAKTLLYKTLKLPPLEKLHPKYFDNSNELRNYTQKLSKLDGRLDASYHVPTVDAILKRLKLEATEVTTIVDPRISKQIILPGRFTRVYVEEGQGTVYFTGKQIFELDPSDKKYLSFARHKTRIKEELTIKENMLLVTCSGSLGKVVLVPHHWDGWTMTHDIIRLVLSSDEIAGYVWIFLTSPYGNELIRRFTYGSVVDHIEKEHIINVPIPLMKDVAVQTEINRLALEANKKRTKAYHLEQEAIQITNEEIIHVEKNS